MHGDTINKDAVSYSTKVIKSKQITTKQDLQNVMPLLYPIVQK